MNANEECTLFCMVIWLVWRLSFILFLQETLDLVTLQWLDTTVSMWIHHSKIDTSALADDLLLYFCPLSTGLHCLTDNTELPRALHNPASLPEQQAFEVRTRTTGSGTFTRHASLLFISYVLEAINTSSGRANAVSFYPNSTTAFNSTQAPAPNLNNTLTQQHSLKARDQPCYQTWENGGSSLSFVDVATDTSDGWPGAL